MPSFARPDGRLASSAIALFTAGIHGDPAGPGQVEQGSRPGDPRRLLVRLAERDLDPRSRALGGRLRRDLLRRAGAKLLVMNPLLGYAPRAQSFEQGVHHGWRAASVVIVVVRREQPLEQVDRDVPLLVVVPARDVGAQVDRAQSCDSGCCTRPSLRCPVPLSAGHEAGVR